MNARILFAALLPLALGACQMTAFEALPEGATTACPKGLPGAWVAQDESKPNEPTDFGVLIHADCSIESRSKGVKHPASGALPKLTFATAAGEELMLIDTVAALDLAELKPGDDEHKPSGYVAFAFKREGAIVELRSVDDRRVATLIVQGAVQGTTHVEHSNRNTEISNLVKEDAAGTARVLASYDLFDREDKMRFRRVGDDARALDRAVKAAGKKARK